MASYTAMVKPENILLTGRHAIVADFGIARAVERAAGDTLTDTGVTLGTPQYMSPEQSTGEREIDARSDIYALGCVLYEMLTGEPPFSGPTVQSIVAKHMTADIPSVRTLRPTVPARTERIIARALAKSPADRYADAGTLLRDLEAAHDVTLGTSRQPSEPMPVARAREPSLTRRPRIPVWMAAVGVVAVLGAFAVWRAATNGDARTPPSTGTSLRSLAVLPFDDVGASAESSYFADGITEEIIDAIGRIPGLRVISRTSAFAFKEKRGLTLRQIADSLKVGTILEGSVRRDGHRLRVIARLVDVAADSQLLTRNFNRELRDVFALQNEIAQDIAGTLRVRLTGAPAVPAASPTTRDIEAYDLYLRGRAQWNRRTPAALREAVRLFEAALARDSMFVAAYVGLADALILNGILGGASPDDALERDPLSPPIRTTLGRALLAAGQIDSAIAQLRLSAELNSNWSFTHGQLGYALSAAGRHDQALAAFRRGAALGGIVDSASLAYGLAAAGERTQAQALLRKVERAPSDVYNLHSAVAMAYVALGDHDAAFRWLERIPLGARGVTFFRLPGFAPIRTDPRYSRLLRDLGLAS